MLKAKLVAFTNILVNKSDTITKREFEAQDKKPFQKTDKVLI